MWKKFIAICCRQLISLKLRVKNLKTVCFETLNKSGNNYYFYAENIRAEFIPKISNKIFYSCLTFY